MGLRVMIVDDHPLVAEALTLAVQQARPLADVDVAADLSTACRRSEDTPYDFVLLDLQLPDSDGLSGLVQLRRLLPDARIAIVTSRANAEAVRSAAELGAVGYMLKTTPFRQLAETCRMLMDGGTVFPALPTTGPGDWDAAAGERLNLLSTAQRRIFLALKGGGSNKQIAYDLELAEATVKAHMTSIFRKMKITNRSQAIVLARRLSGDV